MKETNLNSLYLLDSGSYQTYNRDVARALGSVNAAILLSELINRHRYHEENGELIDCPKMGAVGSITRLKNAKSGHVYLKMSSDSRLRF